MIITPQQIEDITEALEDQSWRLDNLYWIIDQDGNKIQFKRNMVQLELHNNSWSRNMVPKSRQHGITTYIAILFLDDCLFNDNIRAGIIAHRLDDAKRIFRDKIKYAYDNLLPCVKDMKRITKCDQSEIVFDNNSSIYVSTSMRSGTLQRLHVSEYAKLCVATPIKAREVKTGTLETVHENGRIFIESTSEGPFGDFYRMCKSAKTTPISQLDYKLFFFPWFLKESNTTDPQGIEIPDKINDYLNKLEVTIKQKLTPGQRAWYAVKRKDLGNDIYKEHASTLEEAFMAAVEGSYYSEFINNLQERGQICTVPYDESGLVYTSWDLGFDCTAIWFYQVVGREIHIIDYYESSGMPINHYIDMLINRKELYGYKYGTFYMPHDANKREMQTGDTLSNSIKQKGYNVKTFEQEINVEYGINRVMEVLPRCWFDESKCATGIKRLISYRRVFNEALDSYMEVPLHDINSHGADSFRYLTKSLSSASESGMTAQRAKELARQYGY